MSQTRVLTRVALLAAVAAAALAAAGCAASAKVPLTPPLGAVKRDLAYTKAMLYANHRPWQSLDAGCQVTIANPQIPLPDHQVTVGNGRLRFEKPNMVRIVLPDTNDPQVRIVGDGKAYYAAMPLLTSEYSGKYTDPVSPQPGRISFLPADVADALEPTNLFVGRGLTLTQEEQISNLYSVEPLTGPEPGIRTTSLVFVDRREEKLRGIEKYNDDGSIRCRVQYLNIQSVLLKGGQSVQVPVVFDISYPEEQTTIRIQLQGVALNVKMPEGAFDVSAASSRRPAPR
jgi:outer membrane lipoprotein-sorting protein